MPDAATTGRLLLCIAQGMRVLGKTGRTSAEMTDLAEAALKLLDEVFFQIRKQKLPNKPRKPS